MMTTLEKAARILEDITENIECNNIKIRGSDISYKNKELQEFSSLVYRLLHAGLCAGKVNSCSHPDWESEVNKMYEGLFGNEDRL